MTHKTTARTVLSQQGLALRIVERLAPAIAAAVVLASATVMVLRSPLDAHPDEHSHLIAATYYESNWLPAAVGDPRLESTVIGLWGYSYLLTTDPAYFLAAKTTGALVRPFYLGLRVFQLCLFAGLLGLACAMFRSSPALALVLVLTPQIWYVFSYFNGDALPLAVSLALAAFVTTPSGLRERFLSGTSVRDIVPGATIAGASLGVLVLAKTNYAIVIPFALGVLAAKLHGQASVRSVRSVLARMLPTVTVAAAVSGPVVLYDAVINEFDKPARVESFIESHATPPFRPSHARLPDSYEGLYLRAKGLPFLSLAADKGWHGMTLRSFFGGYGYMTYFAPKAFYVGIGTLALVSLLAAGVRAWRSAAFADRLVLLALPVFVALAVVQSLWFSWTKGYQPQGRYLFPIIPMFVMALADGARSLPRRPVLTMILALFLLSLWSFWYVGYKGICP